MRFLFAGLILLLSFPLHAQEDRLARWREDLDYFQQRVPQVHPRPFHTLSRVAFDRLVDELRGDLPNLQDHQIIVRLSGILARFGDRDGHTRVSLGRAGFHALPLNIYPYPEGLYVRAASKDYASLAGARVLRIGDVSADEAFRRVVAITAGDNEMSRLATAGEWMAMPEVLRAVGVASGDPGAAMPMEIEQRGERKQVLIEPVASIDSVKEWIDLRDQAPPPLARRHAALNPFRPYIAVKQNWFTFLPDERLLYVNFNSVLDDTEETLEQFFRRVFNEADAKKPEKLVIDVRNNGGGNNYLIRPIFYHLIRRAETVAAPGRLFVIIGRHTFSAAQNFVDLLHMHTSAIFVGEPTGGAPNHFGDSVRLILPNSKLPVNVASLWWQGADPRDERRWVAPNVAAEATLADDLAGRDPALDAIRSYRPQPSLGERLRAALTAGSATAAEEAFRRWRADPRHKYLSGVEEINRLAAALYGEKRNAEATALFELNARVNPRSWLARHSLGRAYLAAGKKQEALREFESALAIDSSAAPTIVAIDNLRRELATAR